MKNENILLLGGALALLFLRNAKPKGYTLPAQVPGQSSGGAVGKISRITGKRITEPVQAHPSMAIDYLLANHLSSEGIFQSPYSAVRFIKRSKYSAEFEGERGAIYKVWAMPNPKNLPSGVAYGYSMYSVRTPQNVKYFGFYKNKQVELISDIGAIFPEIPPQFYECNDGTFTDRNGRRACTWHGGLKTGLPIQTGGGGSSFVKDVPLSQIQTNPAWFQNRSDAYSTRSVDAIVSAVMDGRFIWSNFDPIQLWQGPGGSLYILSGHSRKEAFKRLSELGYKVDGRGFDTIPAKIETGLTLEQAQQVARESNTLSTPETALERAAYYRNLRKTGEFTLRQLEESAKRTEGRNANKVLAFSFLSTNGKTFAALQALQTADATSFANIETIAQWIGNARKTLPQLTDSHENELYDWLVTGGGYGTRAGQLSSEAAFKSELQKIVYKRTEFGVFDQSQPLNIQSARYASPVEAEYNAQLESLAYEIAELEKEKRDKIKRYAREATPEQLRKILEPLEAGLRIKQQERQRLVLKKTEILDAAKAQTSLFGIRRRA